jgi:hypothetical protein
LWEYEIEEVFAVGEVDWGQVVWILGVFWESFGLEFIFWRKPTSVKKFKLLKTSKKKPSESQITYRE